MNYMPKEERSVRGAKGFSLKDRLAASGGEKSREQFPTSNYQESPYADGIHANDAGAKPHSGSHKRAIGRRYLIVGAIMLGVAIVGTYIATSPAAESGEAVKSALQTGTSKTLPVGVRLATSDNETNLEPRDYTVEGAATSENTKLYVWDYAGEDGDYVQVLVNGEPVSGEFMITHKPREFDIPTNGTVQIKGIHDAGGGLTYAAHYDLNGESYFNIAPEGALNTYTISGS